MPGAVVAPAVKHQLEFAQRYTPARTRPCLSAHTHVKAFAQVKRDEALSVMRDEALGVMRDEALGVMRDEA